MVKKLLTGLTKFFKRAGMFFLRNSRKIAVGALIIAVIALIGMIVSISLINKEQEGYEENIYKELKKVLNSVESEKGSVEEAKKLVEDMQKKHPELFQTVITNNAGDILFSYGSLSTEQDSLLAEMKKFIVYSDMGGFSYVLDQNLNMKYIVYGELGQKNLRLMQKQYESNQGFEWNNFLLSAPGGVGKYFTGGNKIWIEDSGELGYDSKGTTFNGLPFNPVPYTQMITVKPKSDNYYLYTFKWEGMRFGQGAWQLYEDMRWNGLVYSFSNLFSGLLGEDMGIGTPIPAIVKYQLFREFFLILTIISILVFWLFIALWVFLDCRKKKLQPLPWAALVLITNIIGLIVYLTVRPRYIKCKGCGKEIPSNYASCPHCGNSEKKKCKECGSELETEFEYCPACGKSTEVTGAVRK